MKTTRWNHCNVFEAAQDGRRLWQFKAGKDAVSEGHHESRPVDAKPAPRWVGKDWKHLVNPRLNIAWLPPKQVFLRALELPAGDRAELAGMVEFQLEKISPLPPAQVVWTVESFPHPDPTLQSVVVTIVPRAVVEAHIGRLSEAGYIADRIEFPHLRELTVRVNADGLWVLVDSGVDRAHALLAWRTGGILREACVVPMDAGAAGLPTLMSQVKASAWAGELAGWFDELPPIHLVAASEHSALYQNALAEFSGSPVAVHDRVPPAGVAKLTAESALRPVTPHGLVPPETVQIQKQKFVDGLWMGALGAIGMIYLIGTVIYLGALMWRKTVLDETQGNTRSLALQYTNTIQLKEQVKILQEQVDLKFAGLEAWRAVVEIIPPELTLTSLDFRNGRRVSLRGTAPSDATDKINQFNKEMIRVKPHTGATNDSLYVNVKAANIRVPPNNPVATWDFDAELRKGEKP